MAEGQRVAIRAWSAWSPQRETQAAWLAWAGAIDKATSDTDVGLPEVPMMLRRRTTALGRKMIGCALACGETARTGRYVVASRHGEFSRTLGILRTLVASELPSPAEFSMSVHNSLAGLLSIHSGNIRGHTALAAGLDTFGFGLMEAAPLSEDAAQVAAVVFGVPVTEIFGSTETGAIAWRRRDQVASAWQPLPSVAIGSTNDGLLCVRAPHVPGGEHVSSDQVKIEAGGGFRFHGRNDFIAKIEGQRISLHELEEHLRCLAWIADAAVVVLDEPRTELAAAVVPTFAGAAVLSQIGAFRFGRKLRRALAETNEPAGLPRRWRFINALPSGTLGKRRASDITCLFKERDLAITAAARPTEPEIRAIRPLANGAEFDLFIPPEIAYIDGHFPGRPIVPGVAQIDWVVKLAMRHLNSPIETAQEFRVKFRRLTVPNTVVTLSLHQTVPSRRLDFQYSLGMEVLTLGTITINAPKRAGAV